MDGIGGEVDFSRDGGVEMLGAGGVDMGEEEAFLQARAEVEEAGGEASAAAVVGYIVSDEIAHGEVVESGEKR